jgi:acetolactate synthase-1/3 small subunit
MTEETQRTHTIGLLVENRPGVLAKIAGLIAAKGYNIASLSVGATHDPTLSYMTLVVRGTASVIEQCTKQLNRLIDVVELRDYTDDERVERELILVRVASERQDRGEIFRIADIFKAGVVDVTSHTFTLELSSRPEKIDALIELLKPYGIQSLFRTGRVAMRRASKLSGGSDALDDDHQDSQISRSNGSGEHLL